MLIASLHTALPVDGDGAPAWVQLVPAGTFSGADGRGPFRVTNAAALIAASMAGVGRLAIDENHSTDLAAPRGEPAPARGWIVELQQRPDGIWGRVEWTESGRELMADKAYIGISPVFETDKSGRVLRLLRAALTNNPNLTQLATFHHQQGHTMDLVTLRTHLALPADADEAAIVAAVQRMAAEATANAARVTELQARLTTAVSTDVVTQLQAQIATLTAAAAKDKAVAFVEGAIKAGKPIALPLREHYIARHMADAAAVEKEINAMVSINAGGVVVRHDPQDGDALSDTDQAMCKRMGLDPKKFAERRKAMAAERDGKGA